MNTTDKVFTLLNEQNGYLMTREAKKKGIENKVLQRMTDRGLIERVAHGLYVDAKIFPDPFIIAQYRCPKGVFSHETALFLHDLSDRDPIKITMTIPSGWNTKLLTDDNIFFFYNNPKKIRIGICEVETASGMKVKTYDSERTLCDCLKNIEKLDRDLVLTALKRYIKDGKRDNVKLLEYASALKIRDMVYRYLEVLV